MSETVDLMDFPQGLSDQLGIPLFSAQILASIIFLMLPLLPTLLLTRGKNVPAVVIVGMGALGFCVAVGWFPIWVFTIICLIIAFMYGKAIIGVFER